MRTTFWKGLLALLASAAIAATAMACGSDDSADTDGGSDGGATASNCVEVAQNAVDAARKPIPLVLPDRPLDTSKLQGEDVAMILAIQNELIGAIGDGFVAAAEAAGLNARVDDGKGNVNTWNQLVAQSATNGTAGLVLWSMSPELINSSLAKVSAAGIPVVVGANDDPDAPLAAGVEAQTTADFTEDGVHMADYALAENECEGDILFVNYPTYTVLKNMGEGIESQIAKQCPDCNLTVIEGDIASAATKLSPQVATELRKNPDIDVIISSVDGVVQYIQQAANQVGRDLPIIAHDGVAANIEFVRDGTQTADFSYPPNEWVGWAAFDTLARLMLNEEPTAVSTIPIQLIDSTNVGSDDAETFPEYVDFEQKFEAAWAGE